MKRAIAIFIAILFIAFVGIVIYAWVNPDFKATVDTAAKGLGGEIYLRLQGAWLNLMSMASTNGTTFLAYTLGILVVGGITWVGFKTFLWDKRPGWMGRTVTTAPTAQAQSQLSSPELYVPQQKVPVPVTEEKKEPQ